MKPKEEDEEEDLNDANYDEVTKRSIGLTAFPVHLFHVFKALVVHSLQKKI